MIKFDVITIFPEMFSSYLKESLISRAQKKKFIKVNLHNLRNYYHILKKDIFSEYFCPIFPNQGHLLRFYY